MQQLYLYITTYIVPKLKNQPSGKHLNGTKPPQVSVDRRN